MGCGASNQSKGREDYSTLRADSSPNVPLVSAASVRPTARELLVIPDNTSRSSVLQKSNLEKHTLPPEPSTPSHSIDPFQSIVTRESSPIKQSPKPAAARKPAPAVESSPTRVAIPNSNRDTKSRNSHSVSTSKPSRHSETQQQIIHSVPPPTRTRRRSSSPLENSFAPSSVASDTFQQHSSVVSSIATTPAPSVVAVPPATTSTPHTTQKEERESTTKKHHHKKKKKKRTSKTARRESRGGDGHRESGHRESRGDGHRESRRDGHREPKKERRPSKPKEAPPTEATSRTRTEKPPSRMSNSNNSKFKPRLSQKAFSMFSIETPQPCSKSGMKFEELYKLKGVLGTGAFSTVREGHHRTSNEITYAVKCVNRKKLSEEDEAALLDEVGILKELKHPHIIRLYDFFSTPQTYYLVMERMSGGELFDRIVAKAYYNEKEARDVCMILIQAIGYCHEQNVAHRDLKPENLLLLSEEDDSAVKIADFGFSKKCLKPNSLKTQCGTPGYVAPEILDGIPYDTKCDMWSCGVILYILLGGYPPFIESNQRELFKKIRKGDYEFHPEYWSNVSKEAKELISALLTVDPNRRLTAEEALDNTWIRGDDDDLEKKDLGPNLAELKKFNAKRKFKAAAMAVMASNKLKSLGEDFAKNL